MTTDLIKTLARRTPKKGAAPKKPARPTKAAAYAWGVKRRKKRAAKKKRDGFLKKAERIPHPNRIEAGKRHLARGPWQGFGQVDQMLSAMRDDIYYTPPELCALVGRSGAGSMIVTRALRKGYLRRIRDPWRRAPRLKQKFWIYKITAPGIERRVLAPKEKGPAQADPTLSPIAPDRA